MITDSETFRSVTAELDTTSSFSDPVLLRETANARLYRVSKASKYFIIKTTKDNSSLQLSILKREYEMSVSFNHFHIAHHYTYEPLTPVGPGIVMEYIDGRNLSEYLNENPSVDSRRRVFSQILDAVAYIHKSGIIHNDIKPENILISRADSDVKIIDFGLSDNDAYYLAKTLGCTPTYASPELLAHDGPIDARSDIFSLGRIMQQIFGNKYSAISQRCVNLDPNRRYDNVDQLIRHWRKIQQRPSQIAIALLIAILTPSIFLIGYISSPTRIDTTLQEALADSLHTARTEARVTQAKLDSVVAANNAIIAAENRRRANVDSICRSFDKFVANLYNTAVPQIKSQHYTEFANPKARKVFFDPLWDEQKRLNFAEYESLEMQNQILTHITKTGSSYTAKINDITQSMPLLNDITNNDEKIFYFNLLNADQPYRPYQP